MRCLGLVVVTLGSVAVLASGALAIDRPLVSLVPADASSYVELHADLMLGRAPATAPLGQALAQMKSPQLVAELWTELAKDEPEMARVTELIGTLGGAFEAIGPRLGVAVWSADLQSIIGGAMANQAAGGAQAAMKMLPRFLLVADVRDTATLDDAITTLAGEAGLEPRVTESGGMKTFAIANGMVELIRGADWLALSFPPEPARKAADRATGVAADSLLTNADYRKAVGRLPADAAYTEYVSPVFLRQLIAAVNMVAPTAGISYPPDEPFAGAMGIRIEEADGRKMASVYYTADLDSLVSAMDAGLALQVTLLRPIIEQQREQARRQALSDQCGSQLEALATAMDSYLADHDNQYPPADRWVREIRRYLEDVSVLKCPEDTSEGLSSYAMNAALSGLSPDEVAEPEWTVLLYETAHPGVNPSGGPDDVPDSPRHVDGNNFAFVDGSVAAFAPDDEEQPVWRPEEPTTEDDEESDVEENGEGEW